MPRLTKDQWAEARIKWESDPTLTFGELGQQLGVSHVAVGQAAKKQGWERAPDMRSIADRAQLKADAREHARKLTSESYNESYKSAGGETLARAMAEDIRADVIDRHRADWAEHRVHFTTSDIAADFDKGKSAKISSEMLAIRQKGERAAYGLDDTTGTAEIEIVRSYGGKA